MAKRYHQSGNAESWRMQRKVIDVSRRHHIHGPIQPMIEPPKSGWWARMVRWWKDN